VQCAQRFVFAIRAWKNQDGDARGQAAAP
jgi:hypothetical protein